MSYDLDFERSLADLDKHIQHIQKRGRPDERAQLPDLQRQLETKTRELYAKLSAWERVQVARHKNRPYTADYIKLMCDDFFELRGDRRYGDDRAILGGIASIEGKTLMVLGNEKGREMKDKIECNFGVTHPEGYRKAVRIMQEAERFHFPVVTLIDTAGASPDLASEERGIALAIAENLFVMTTLRTPIISVVVGEGGSGGALGISIADRILMLEHAIYTVASPEAAASIMWRDSKFAPQAAEAMKITAQDLVEMGLIKEIIPEPLGGAHRDHQGAAAAIKGAILRNLAQLEAIAVDALLVERYERYRSIGVYAREAIGAGAPG
jgi:acetyl-CoA carboxylase carboxyl transferase subunit alpha